MKLTTFSEFCPTEYFRVNTSSVEYEIFLIPINKTSIFEVIPGYKANTETINYTWKVVLPDHHTFKVWIIGIEGKDCFGKLKFLVYKMKDQLHGWIVTRSKYVNTEYSLVLHMDVQFNLTHDIDPIKVSSEYESILIIFCEDMIF